MRKMDFLLDAEGITKNVTINYEQVYAIGYAGRDITKTMAHIKELEEQLGVPAPQKIPTIFQCGNYTLTRDPRVHMLGEQTSGEVEYVIVKQLEKVYIGLGSDHTDRALEGASVPKAKQICAKPIADKLWDYTEIKVHWDQIQLTSEQAKDGEVQPYQQGTLADILPVERILEELDKRVGQVDFAVIFSGTVPLLDGFVYGDRFVAKMIDPVKEREIVLDYGIDVITEEER